MPPPTASRRALAGGLAPGDTVALAAHVPQFLVAYFGILKAGCVVVPMNVLFKAGEAAYVLRDCNARMFVTWAGVADEAAKVPPMRECRTSWCSTHPGCRTPHRTPLQQLLEVPVSGPPPLHQCDPGETAVIVCGRRRPAGRRAQSSVTSSCS